MLFTILAESYEVWPSRRKVLLASVACRLAARAVGETRLRRKDRSVRNGGHPCRCHQMDLMERTSTTQRRDGSALRQPRPAWALSRADEVEPRLLERPALLCDGPALTPPLRHLVGEQRRRFRSRQHGPCVGWRIRETRGAHAAL